MQLPYTNRIIYKSKLFFLMPFLWHLSYYLDLTVLIQVSHASMDQPQSTRRLYTTLTTWLIISGQHLKLQSIFFINRVSTVEPTPSLVAKQQSYRLLCGEHSRYKIYSLYYNMLF